MSRVKDWYGVNFKNGYFTNEIILADRAVPHTRTTRCFLQQDGRHQVRDEPGVDGSEGPLLRVGILRVRVLAGAGLGRQQVRGDAESAGREEDVQNMIGYEQFGIALRTEVKKVNISKSFHM